MGLRRLCTFSAVLVVVSFLVGCGGKSTPLPPVAPSPAISGLSPSTTAAGSAAFTLTVNGSNFVAGSQIMWSNAAQTTTFVSASQLTTSIPASDVAVGGSVAVAVQNAVGVSSSSMPFAVTNPQPTLTALAPAIGIVGSGVTSVTLTGTNFVVGSVVNFAAAARPTTFVSSTQVSAQFTAADLSAVGSVDITVTNASPGGGVAGSLAFSIVNPAPVLTSLSPATAVIGATGMVVGANGSGFVASSQVLWNGSARPTTFVSGTQLTAVLTTADLASAGTASVSVSTAGPGGGSSAGLPFSVGNPLPMLTAIAPTNVVAGDAAFALSLVGSNFISGSTAMVNGSSRATTFRSSTSLIAAISAADVATAGSASVTVVTAGPGGGTSATRTLTIQVTANPVPGISLLTPSTVNAGTGGFSLAIVGSGFVQGSTVLWNGAARPTTFASSSAVTAQILAADVATAGTVNVSVTSPAPGGGVSGTLPFIVAVPPNPVPAIASLAPASVGANSAAFTLTVNGSGFASTSQVLWNGSPRTTTYVSASVITATIPANDVTTQGTANVTVSSPTPGGGVSNASVFTVGPQVNALPTITLLTPSSATVAASPAPLTIAIAGTGFLSTSTVQINGYVQYGSSTAYQSATMLQFTIPANFFSSVQTLQIAVVNQAPGGGTSMASPFLVTAPANSKYTMQTINVAANDIVWDATHNTFYVSTPSTSTPSGNSILPISVTGQLGTAVFAGSEPGNLAISSDSSLLYTAVTGADKIQRFTLPGLGTDLAFTLGADPNATPYAPLDLGVAPGAPHTIAVLRNNNNYSAGNVLIFDDATARAKVSGQGYYFYNQTGKNAIVWGRDAQHLYADSSIGNYYLTSFGVDAGGIASSTTYQSTNYNNSTGIHFDQGTGYVYDNSGHITDPATGLPVGSYASSGVMTTDATLNVAYFLGQTQGFPYPNTYTLAAFDLTKFTPIATTTLYGVSGMPTRLIRFGADGLAFVTMATSSGFPGPSPSQVYILNGSFVSKPSAIVNRFEGGVALPQDLRTLKAAAVSAGAVAPEQR